MPTRRALSKWMVLTVVCGGQSFFWGGIVTDWSVVPMLLGMATLIFVFASIDSHPRYQAARGKNKRLARALDLGIRLRWIYAFLYPLALLFGRFIPHIPDLAVLIVSADVWIGMSAIEATRALTGVWVNLAQHQVGAPAAMDAHSLAYQASVYLTTLITGWLHTLILALLCAIIYGVLRCFGRPKTASTD